MRLVPIVTALALAGMVLSAAAPTPSGLSRADRPQVGTTQVVHELSAGRVATVRADRDSASPAPAIDVHKTFAWERGSVAEGLPVRLDYEVVHDQAGDRWVLFSGGALSGPELYDGTFVRQGRSWSELPTSDAPSPRRSYAMAYDAARAEVVLFGGETGCEACADDETWVLSGDTWTRRRAASPSRTAST